MAAENHYFKQAEEAAKSLHKVFGPPADIAVVLGSGLGSFTDELENQHLLGYKDIPGGIPSSVQGHAGKFVYGQIAGKRILVLSGRLHGFEGHCPHDIAHFVRSVRLWGVEKFIITNATGGIRKTLKPGSIVMIKDQINFTGRSSLTGTELFGGERFPDVSDIFSKDLRKKVHRALKRKKMDIKEAIYIGVNGPAFETAAEIRAFRTLGADIVGMSTVFETLALIQMNAQILGLSCVCNYGTGILNQPLNHQEVLDAGKHAQAKFRKILKTAIEAIV